MKTYLYSLSTLAACTVTASAALTFSSNDLTPGVGGFGGTATNTAAFTGTIDGQQQGLNFYRGSGALPTTTLSVNFTNGAGSPLSVDVFGVQSNAAGATNQAFDVRIPGGLANGDSFTATIVLSRSLVGPLVGGDAPLAASARLFDFGNNINAGLTIATTVVGDSPINLGDSTTFGIATSDATAAVAGNMLTINSADDGSTPFDISGEFRDSTGTAGVSNEGLTSVSFLITNNTGSDLGETRTFRFTVDGMVVPEPSTGLFSLLGLGSLLIRRRR